MTEKLPPLNILVASNEPASIEGLLDTIRSKRVVNPVRTVANLTSLQEALAQDTYDFVILHDDDFGKTYEDIAQCVRYLDQNQPACKMISYNSGKRPVDLSARLQETQLRLQYNLELGDYYAACLSSDQTDMTWSLTYAGILPYETKE